MQQSGHLEWWTRRCRYVPYVAMTRVLEVLAGLQAQRTRGARSLLRPVAVVCTTVLRRRSYRKEGGRHGGSVAQPSSDYLTAGGAHHAGSQQCRRAARTCAAAAVRQRRAAAERWTAPREEGHAEETEGCQASETPAVSVLAVDSVVLGALQSQNCKRHEGWRAGRPSKAAGAGSHRRDSGIAPA